jgi:hypothetical protein
MLRRRRKRVRGRVYVARSTHSASGGHNMVSGRRERQTPAAYGGRLTCRCASFAPAMFCPPATRCNKSGEISRICLYEDVCAPPTGPVIPPHPQRYLLLCACPSALTFSWPRSRRSLTARGTPPYSGTCSSSTSPSTCTVHNKH